MAGPWPRAASKAQLAYPSSGRADSMDSRAARGVHGTRVPPETAGADRGERLLATGARAAQELGCRMMPLRPRTHLDIAAMPKHIGIVACSAEGAALCYRTICTEGAGLLGPHAHPEVSMHTHSLDEYVRCLHRDDWPAVGELMLASANKLASIGAELLICPDNTIHRAMPYVEPRSPLPWLHIAEVVAARAAERGFRRLGLTGTRWLVDSEVYPEKLARRGLGCVRPAEAERDEINRIIMDELVYGVFKPEATAYLQRSIARMKMEGCDAVVLGCTEIPLLMNDSNSPLPTLDSTRELARAALRQAVGAPVTAAQADAGQ